jgi:hypothetical protein
VDRIADDIRNQQIEHLAKRAGRAAERARQQRQTDITQHYQRLRANPPAGAAVPPLATFRDFPVIATLQAKDAPSVAADLKNDSGIRGLVEDALQRWTRDARDGLGERLGTPRGWRDPSARVLHPVDRPDARFVCTECHHVPRRAACDGALDFAAACAHECPTEQGRRRRATAPWDSEKFDVDADAADVVRRAAAMAGVKIEEKSAREELEALGLRWTCKSCAVPIIMPFGRIVSRPPARLAPSTEPMHAQIGHAKRHATPMILELLSHAPDPSSAPPYEAGALRKYLWPGTYIKECDKAVRDAKVWVCRHCFPVVPGGTEMGRAKECVTTDTARAKAKAQSCATAGTTGSNAVTGTGSNAAAGGGEGSSQVGAGAAKGPKNTSKKLMTMSLTGLSCHAKGKCVVLHSCRTPCGCSVY